MPVPAPVPVPEKLELLLALATLAACDPAPVSDATPPAGEEPVAEANATTGVIADPPPPPDPAAEFRGWWRSGTICLELFENGDFELSDQSKHGRAKVLVMGSADLAVTDERAAVRLKVDRIWHSRFTGPCRKVHEFGGFQKEQTMLSDHFEPGDTLEWRIQKTGPDSLELCGSSCVQLERDDRHLGARWEKPRPERGPATGEHGELLELCLHHNRAFVRVAGEDGKGIRVDGRAEAKWDGGDRFTVNFRAPVAGPPGHAPPVALNGRELRDGKPRTFFAERLAGEKLRVCEGDQCTVFERMFDSSSHDLH